MNFALLAEPIDYQLTVHYNNYGGVFTEDFNYVIGMMNVEHVQKHKCVMYNLINYYGVEKIQFWIETFILKVAV